MFNDITHAFSVLSNPARRDHYDQMVCHQYTKDEALSTFDRFFRHNGIEEEEKEFFSKHYPNRKQNYYETLGVKRDASFQEIDAAYRSKALELHPRNRPDDKDAESKFVSLSEAYNNLRDTEKRKTYDNIEFGELPAHHAHRQFVDKFEDDHEFHQDEKNKEVGGLVKKMSQKDQSSKIKSKNQQNPQHQHQLH